MKKILKLMPEYHCWALWLYDELGNFLDNIIPEGFHQNKELMAALTDLQEQFDALYLNTPKEFTYLGFADETAKSGLWKPRTGRMNCCAMPHGTNMTSFMRSITRRCENLTCRKRVGGIHCRTRHYPPRDGADRKSLIGMAPFLFDMPVPYLAPHQTVYKSVC